jgi:ElaB/YqjD/DUF883 family membrane-anchored ribosome-binding protein
MNSHEQLAEEPARIEREIVHTRASLHRKLDEIQHRLNPREQALARAERVKEALQNIDPTPYAGIAAAAAVGVGAVMALKGLRRRSYPAPVTPTAEDMMGE